MATDDPYERELRAAAREFPDAPARWERVIAGARRKRRRRLFAAIISVIALALALALAVLTGKSAVDPTFNPPISILRSSASVETSAFSPDGRKLLMASAD